MKKSLARKITLSILAGAVLMSSNVVWANIVDSSGKVLWTEDVPGEYVRNAVDNPDGVVPDNIYNSASFIGIKGGTGASVNGGKVTITGGKFTDSAIRGGAVIGGSASNNTVSITGVEVDSEFSVIQGGLAFNQNTTGEASNNTVTINAEYGKFKDVYGGNTSNGNANNNTVTIERGTFKGAIRGGLASNGKTAYGNTVSIGKDAILDTGLRIYGGAISSTPCYGASVGKPNTLNINNRANNNTNIAELAGFDVINFNNCKWDDGEIVVQTGNFSFDSDLKINVNGMTTTDDIPEVDDEMTLVKSDNAMSEEYKPSRATFMASGYERVIGEVYKTDDNKNINLKVKDISANEAILAFGESRAAASALTNQGSELIETGLDALARDNDKDTKVFAALYGNASEYETGSHVKVNGWNGIVGVGKTNANGVTMGAFFENGEGNYRTFNEYEGEFMRGDGEATYNGGGFLYRKDTDSGVYTEASLRAGNLQNELRNVVIAGDELVGYDIDTFYYGAHVGIGKVIPRGNEGDSIDVYGKFIYTHHDSEDFTIDGDDFHFDSVDSERLRLGFRINEVQTNKLAMYYGAAWEYEFGGDANNTVVGYDLSTPSLGGSTVIGEIGAHYKASDKWSIDLNGRAYVGQREGFSGSVQANYSF